MAQFKQGKPITFYVDAEPYGTIDKILVEVAQNNSTVHKFQYPVMEGFNTLTKDGDVYTGSLTTTMTTTMKGVYGIELTTYLSGVVTNKDGNENFIEVTIEAK